MATYKPTEGAQALAADLAKRGGPKRPSIAERKATVERIQKRPPLPMKVNDQQMIAGGGRRLERNPLPGPVRPQSDMPFRPPMAGGPAYRGPSGYNSAGATSGGSFPGQPPAQNRTFLPTFPQGSQPQRPPMSGPPSNFQSGGSFPSAPPARPQGGNTQVLTQLIKIMSLLTGGQEGEWGESSQRATTDPRTWDVSPWGR